MQGVKTSIHAAQGSSNFKACLTLACKWRIKIDTILRNFYGELFGIQVSFQKKI